MTHIKTLSELRKTAALLRAKGVTGLYLFGSVARGTASPSSDIDLFLDYDPASGFSLIELVDIKYQLEAILHTTVDITTRDSLHPLLRSDIEKSAVQVF